MQRVWISAAGLFGAAAVALAALAAHAELAARGMVQNVAMILGWHAPALLALALWNRRGGHAAAALLLAGGVLFAGAVLLRAFADVSLGPVAPIGGFLMIAGWLWLALAAWRL
ncbi:MAG: DUF423 domain-containing protein [Roseococcus sp.]